MKLLAIAAFSAALVLSPISAFSSDVLQATTGAGTAKAAATTPADERDPVCGMTVDPAKAKEAGRTSVYEGRTFYFCNDSCKKQFDADPAKYAKPPKSPEKTDAMNGCCCSGRGMQARAANAGPGGKCCRHGR